MDEEEQPGYLLRHPPSVEWRAKKTHLVSGEPRARVLIEKELLEREGRRYYLINKGFEFIERYNELVTPSK